MKILYVGRVPSWNRNAYGGEEHMEQIAMGMAADNDRYDVLFLNAWFNGLQNNVQFKKIPYCHCPITQFLLYPKTERLREVIEGFDPDLIHHFSRFGYSTERLRERGAIENIPTINLAVASRERQNNAAILSLMSKGRFHSVLSLILDRYTIKHSDIVITPSGTGKKILSNAFETEKNKIRVIPRGINLQSFLAVDWSKVEKGLVLYVGRLDTEKGLEYIIEAMRDVFSHVKNARLVIVGDGRAKKKLKEKASELGIDDKIQFIGRISHDAIASEYKKCNVALSHSAYESFGASVAEAMAMARPVVVADRGGVRDIVTEGVNGYLIPFGDTIRITKAVTTLLLDDGRARTFGLNGRYSVEERFSLDSEIRHFGALYEEMIRNAD